MSSCRELNGLILGVSSAIDRKGPGVQRNGRGSVNRVCDGHRPGCVKRAAWVCGLNQGLAVRARADTVENVYSQNIGRAIRDRRCIGARGCDDAVLQEAVFLVDRDHDTRARRARGKVGVTGVARV